MEILDHKRRPMKMTLREVSRLRELIKKCQQYTPDRVLSIEHVWFMVHMAAKIDPTSPEYCAANQLGHHHLLTLVDTSIIYSAGSALLEMLPDDIRRFCEYQEED